MCLNLPVAQAVGDACVDDFDGDGVKDNDDHCPYVKHMSKTSFLDYFTVDLYPGHGDQLPDWRVAEKVCLAQSRHNYIRLMCFTENSEGFCDIVNFLQASDTLSYHMVI